FFAYFCSHIASNDPLERRKDGQTTHFTPNLNIMIKEFIEKNEARRLDELFSLISIPSVSAQPEHKADMVRCAERWKELLLAAG
ncbi:hypothetical protein, partial [Klebsiella pneumoniae]|uniref:hypothetical protein n=1 Tax=Klebsiella pneumoniae TaxID=573 RepID=UPI0025A28AE3